MGVLTPAQLAQLAYAAGFRNGTGYQGRGLTWAVAVALAESGGNTDARNVNNDAQHSIDRGLWQLNNYWHREVSDAQAYSPTGAAAAVFAISKGGADWHEWASMSNGAAAAQLGRAALAAPTASSSTVQNASWQDWTSVPGIASQLLGIGGGAVLSTPLGPGIAPQVLGLGGAAVGSAAGGVAGAVGGVEAIARSMSMLASIWLKAALWWVNPHNWTRLALVVGGGVGLLMALEMLASSGIGGPVGGVAQATAGVTRGARRAASNTAKTAALAAAA